MFNCLNIIFNVNTLLEPYLPFSFDIVSDYLNQSNLSWEYKKVNAIKIKEDITPLYTRYDKKLIEEETIRHLNKRIAN